MPKRPRRPDPPPYDVDDRPFVAAGMVAWAVVLIVLVVFFRDDLRRHHAEWWLWTCLIGIGLGLYGYRFVGKRRR